ncbi:DUF3927 family protein (plasmid) [Klebsiella variicola]|nr:DUF3927 family protein [Klebsiella variicola]
MRTSNGGSRLAVVAILLVLVVLVDFTGKLMSIAADGVLVELAIYFAQPLYLKNRSDRRGLPGPRFFWF